MKKVHTYFADLLSKPIYRDAVRRRMSKLERQLTLLASSYFGEKITIIYAKGAPKIDTRNAATDAGNE